MDEGWESHFQRYKGTLDELIGTILKGYEFHAHIGSGGFGRVYRANQSSIGRDVAIKIIHSQFASQPDFIRRFEKEAHTVARLEHPGITPIHDYWRDPSGAYLVMRFLRGGNLREVLHRKRFALANAALLLDQIAAALHSAHRSGVVHHDVKPENILFDEDDNAYLCDFGIANNSSVPSAKSNTDYTLGTLKYLSPEQLQNQKPSSLADIYSLGIVLFEVIAGRYPFGEESTPEQLIRSHLHEPLPSLTELAPHIANPVNVVLQKATAKEPSQRYSDVLRFAEAFREAAGLTVAGTQEELVETLTLREHEILQHIVAGKSNREIAKALHVTVNTVKWYIRQIYKKLRTRNRVQAIVRARELHLIDQKPSPTHVTYHSTGITLPEPHNPYKGLEAFESADSQHFFGREELVLQLLEMMADAPDSGTEISAASTRFQRFLAIVGPSGSGKSSLVKAGLMPALWRGDLPDSETWFVVEMVPGSNPISQMVAALSWITATDTVNLSGQLRHDPKGLIHTVNDLLPDDGSELVLVIDQFEEMFTLVRDETIRAHCLDLIVEAATAPESRVRIVITLRADYYDRPLRYPQFGELLRSRMITVLPLTPEGLEAAILRPAQQVGLVFEAGLVASIIAEVGLQPGALPLLQYALTELFEHREGRLLSHQAYHAIGGVVGALAKRAEELYTILPDDSKPVARRLFLRLVVPSPNSNYAREYVTRDELNTLSPNDELLDELIDTYVSYRLLSLDHDPVTRVPVVTIAHEALLETWGRLQTWLEESQQDLLARQRLQSSVAEWQAAQHDPSFLATGVRLAQFEALAQADTVVLNETERDYLRTSMVEYRRREREQRTQQRRLLRLQSVIILMLIVSLVVVTPLSIFTYISRNQARSEARIAFSRQLAAQSVAELQRPLGNDEFAALLAIKSLNYHYDPIADGALVTAGSALPLRSFAGHDDVIYDVAFSPDDRFVLTGSGDGTARLWNAASGEVVRIFTGHTGEIYSLAWSPDGRFFLTGGTDQIARLWDVETGEVVQRFTGHTDEITAVAFSPDGTLVLTDSRDQSARLWQVATGQTIRVISNCTGHGVAFSPDGQMIATSGDPYTTRLWDAKTGQLVHTLEGHKNNLNDVAFSPDGRLVITGSLDNTARLWNVETGNELFVLSAHSSSVRGVAFSHDGQYVLTGSSDYTARLWEVASGKEVRAFRAHFARLWSVAFSSDDTSVLTGSADATAKLWAIRTDRDLHTLRGHQDEVYGVTTSPDGLTVLTGSADGTAMLWDSTTGAALRTFHGHEEVVYAVAFAPDGTTIATGSADQTARLWDVASGEILRSLQGHEGIVYSVAFSPDGRALLTGSADGTARLWDLATGETIQIFSDYPAEIRGVAFSPDGQFIATANSSDVAHLWDVRTGDLIKTFTGHADTVHGVAFSPDGNYLVTGSSDQTVRLWQISTGKQVRLFAGHTNTVYSVAISPDGESVVAGSSDRTAWVWDISTGKVKRVLRGHSGAVWGVTFLPDNERVLTGSLDHTAELWHVDYRALLEGVCGRLLRDFSDEERQSIPIEDTNPTCPSSRGS